MGVPELWDTIKNGLGKRIPFEVFAEQFLVENGRPVRIAIDGHNWLFEVFKGHKDSDKVKNFMSRVRTLLTMNVSFVIVFDGRFKPSFKRNFKDVEFPDEDYSQLYRQALSKIHAEPTNDVEPRTGVREYDEVFQRIRGLLKAHNCSYIISAGEGEAECAYLQALGVVDYVMTNDGDSLLFGATKVLRNYLDFLEDVPPGASREGLYHSDKCKWVTPVHMDTVTQTTGFDRWRMILFALLVGLDYSSGVRRLGADRGAKIALLGSSKQSLYVKEGQEMPNISDFSVKLRKIYSTEALFQTHTRLQQLKDFINELQTTLTTNSYEIFGLNLLLINFVDNEGKLIGPPQDKVILSFAFPTINRTNVFRFVNGMSNLAEKNYVLHPQLLDTTVLDLDHIIETLGDTPDGTLKIRGCSGAGNFEFIVCENVYRKIQGKWECEASTVHESVSDDERKRLERDFSQVYTELTEKYNYDGSKVVEFLDRSHLMYIIGLNSGFEGLNDTDCIFFDRHRLMNYPSVSASKAFAEENGLTYQIESLLVKYNKRLFFETKIPQSKKQKDLPTKNGSMSSIRVPKAVALYYAPEKVKELESKRPLKRSLRKKTRSLQSNTLDNYMEGRSLLVGKRALLDQGPKTVKRAQSQPIPAHKDGFKPSRVKSMHSKVPDLRPERVYVEIDNNDADITSSITSFYNDKFGITILVSSGSEDAGEATEGDDFVDKSLEIVDCKPLKTASEMSEGCRFLESLFQEASDSEDDKNKELGTKDEPIKLSIESASEKSGAENHVSSAMGKELLGDSSGKEGSLSIESKTKKSGMLFDEDEQSGNGDFVDVTDTDSANKLFRFESF